MLKLKVPPVAVTILCGLFMKLIAMWVDAGSFQLPYHHIFIYGLFACAACIGIAGVMEFIRQSTTVNPHKPEKAQKLVTGGIYRFSRNPMYLALLILLTCWGFYLGHFLTFLMLPLFVWYMNENQIKPEEEVMLTKFDDEYDAYRDKVRRWL